MGCGGRLRWLERFLEPTYLGRWVWAFGPIEVSILLLVHMPGEPECWAGFVREEGSLVYNIRGAREEITERLETFVAKRFPEYLPPEPKTAWSRLLADDPF
jgi:hypothetical protein